MGPAGAGGGPGGGPGAGAGAGAGAGWAQPPSIKPQTITVINAIKNIFFTSFSFPDMGTWLTQSKLLTGYYIFTSCIYFIYPDNDLRILI